MKVGGLDNMINGWLALHTPNTEHDTIFLFPVNIGSNDLADGTTESSFKTSYASVLNKILAVYPRAIFFLTYPARRGFNTEGAAMKTWIQAIISDFAISDPDHVFAGDDELVWFENGDDFATYSDDGIHQNAAGQIEGEAQKEVIIKAYLTSLGH